MITELANMGLFEALDALTAPISTITQYKTAGLRALSRPHDLYTVVDKENGEIKNYIISTVYTPFSKDDITVKTKVDKNGARLIVNIEKSEKNDYTTDKVNVDKDKNSVICQYCGISKRGIKYEIPLNDRIVLKDISVKAEDGILTITLPVDHSDDSETLVPIQ